MCLLVAGDEGFHSSDDISGLDAVDKAGPDSDGVDWVLRKSARRRHCVARILFTPGAAPSCRSPLLRGPSPPPVTGRDRGQTLLLSQLTPERQSHAVPRRGFPAARRRGETAESRLLDTRRYPVACPPGRLHRERERVSVDGTAGQVPHQCGRHRPYRVTAGRALECRLVRTASRAIGPTRFEPRNNEFAPPDRLSVISTDHPCDLTTCWTIASPRPVPDC